MAFVNVAVGQSCAGFSQGIGFYNVSGCPPSIHTSESNTDGLYYYYKVDVQKSSGSDKLSLKLLSPSSVPLNEGLVATDPAWDGGYDVFISKDCVPQKNGWTVLSVEDRSQAKLVEIPLSFFGDGTYYISLLSRNNAGVRPLGKRSVACSMKLWNPFMIRGEGSAMTCDKGLQPVPVSSIAVEVPLCNVRIVSSGFRSVLAAFAEKENKTPKILMGVLIPVGIILLAIAIFLFIHYRRKKKKQDRMGKFAALSRGQLGGNPGGAVPSTSALAQVTEVTM